MFLMERESLLINADQIENEEQLYVYRSQKSQIFGSSELETILLLGVRYFTGVIQNLALGEAMPAKTPTGGNS